MATKTKKNPQHPAVRAGSPEEMGSVFTALEKQIRAVSDDDVRQLNVDVPRTVAYVLAAIPRLTPYIPAMRKLATAAAFDVAAVEQLRSRALALYHTHLLASPKPMAGLDVNVKEGGPLKKSLLAWADAMVIDGRMDPAAVAAVREGSGFLDLGNDLVALSSMFTAAWSTLPGANPELWTKVERASELGFAILQQLGDKQAPAPDAVRLRDRAFTLFAQSYDEARRGLTFLCWHEGDVNDVLPTIYGGRRGSSEAAVPPSADEPTPSVPVTAPVAPATPVVPTGTGLPS